MNYFAFEKIPRSLQLNQSTMTFNIRCSLLFKGIPISGDSRETRVVCYVDVPYDTTVITQNEVSVSETLAIFNKYSQASGAEINLNKTVALVIIEGASGRTLGTLIIIRPQQHLVPSLRVRSTLLNDVFMGCPILI
jgi:hypothetical protein